MGNSRGCGAVVVTGWGGDEGLHGGPLDLVLNDRWTTFSGMEYPGFVLLIAPNSPVVREVAHQWWYGLVGNNEYADPWLDEAFAMYATDVFAGGHRVAC